MKKHGWIIGLAILGGCLVIKYFEAILSFLNLTADVLSPLVMGCVVAYILNIVLRTLEKKYVILERYRWAVKIKRPVCILLSFGFVALILTGVFLLVVPEIGSSFQILAAYIPEAVESVIEFLTKHSDEFPAVQKMLEKVELDWPKLFHNALGIATSGIGSIFNSAISAAGLLFNGVFNLVIGLIFAVYLLANKEKLSKQIGKLAEAYVPDKIRSVSEEFVKLLDQSFSCFIVGQCTEAVILGTLCMIGMLILRLPYAVMTGVIVGVTALIPIVGAYIGAGVGGFMIFMVDPMKALVFVIFLVVLQQLEGNIIYPKVVGSSIGLPGMWVLASVTIGGGLMGVVGMLIGVPLAATLYKWIGRCTNQRLLKCQEEAEAQSVIKTEESPEEESEEKHTKKKHESHKKKNK